MNRKEFYRLRSKFRLLKRVYDDMDYPPEISFYIDKLSKKPLDAQSIQLIIAEPPGVDNRTWVQQKRMKMIFFSTLKPTPLPASLYMSMLPPEGRTTSEEYNNKIKWLKEREDEGHTIWVTP